MSQFDKNPDYDEIFTQIAGRAGGIEFFYYFNKLLFIFHLYITYCI